MRLHRSATGFGNLFRTILLLTAVNLALLFEVQFSKPEIEKDIDIYMCWKSTFHFFAKVFHSNDKCRELLITI